MSAEPHTNCVLKTHLGASQVPRMLVSLLDAVYMVGAVVHPRSGVSGHETGDTGRE
jgi:hypothetical protein